MSLIKKLKQDPENILSIIDILELFSGGKSKYIEMLLRILKKTADFDDYALELKQELIGKYNLDTLQLNKYNKIQITFIYIFCERLFNCEDLKLFQKFCYYNECGMINQNDLSTYDSFQKIEESVKIADIKNIEKEMEKQIVKIYDDETWLIIRPLTHEASNKYGASTKWCTTTKDNYEYFEKYSKRGILLYILNKVNGLKVAVFFSLDLESEFSFWNDKDVRIDSMESKLPDNILGVIKKEINENKKTNYDYLSKIDKNKINLDANIKKGDECLRRIGEARANCPPPLTDF